MEPTGYYPDSADLEIKCRVATERALPNDRLTKNKHQISIAYPRHGPGHVGGPPDNPQRVSRRVAPVGRASLQIHPNAELAAHG